MRSTTGSFVRSLSCGGILALGSWLGLRPAAAEYLIRPGDVLGFSIIGLPDLASKATVGSDGDVVLPVAGAVAVGNASLAEAQRRIQMALARANLNRQADDGRQLPVVITAAQVSVSIAEYRPVYIDGDVARPGAVAFRPGLTVRQAMALAGGVGLGQAKQPGGVADTASLTQTYNELSVTFATTQLEIARLQAEISGHSTMDLKVLVGLPVAPKLREELLDKQQQLLVARDQAIDREKDYLVAASKREEERASILNQQQQKDDEGVKIDEADLSRLQELFKKGAIALPTLSEARRSVLQSSTRALQTTATLGSVQREQSELGERSERLTDTRRVDDLKSLSDAASKLAVTRAQLEGVGAKLREAGVKPQVGLARNDQISVTITRAADVDTPTTIQAGLDTQLSPGDVLSVAVPSIDTPLGQ